MWAVFGPQTISHMDALSLPSGVAAEVRMLPPFTADWSLKRGAKPVNSSGAVASLA